MNSSGCMYSAQGALVCDGSPAAARGAAKVERFAADSSSSAVKAQRGQEYKGTSSDPMGDVVGVEGFWQNSLLDKLSAINSSTAMQDHRASTATAQAMERFYSSPAMQRGINNINGGKTAPETFCGESGTCGLSGL